MSDRNREAFEAWMRSVPGHQSLAKEYMNEDSGRYDSPFTELMWQAWQAASKGREELLEALKRISMAKPDCLDHSIDVAIIERMASIARAVIQKNSEGAKE